MSTLVSAIEQKQIAEMDFVGPPTESSLAVGAAASSCEDTEAVVCESQESELLLADVTLVDQAQANTARVDADNKSRKFAVGDLIKKFGSLSGIVRTAGVAAVVLSMCLFLLDGMGVVNDTQRFFTMLIMTGLLSAGGFALAFLLKEQRGARSFFGLAALSVPVNFTVLGALFYSVVQFDSIGTVYPTVALWKIQSVASLGSAALIAAVALIPVTIISLSVMAREARTWLSGALLVSSSMLLLPIRDTSFIAPIVALIVVALISLVKKRGEGLISLKTPAGRFVQFLLFVPPAIMLFRSFWLYDVSTLSALVIALTVFAALRYAGQRIKPVGLVANTMHLISVIVAFAAALLSVDVVSGVSASIYEALVFSLVFGGLMFDIEHRVKNAKLARAFGIGSYLLLCLITLVYQQLYDGLLVFIAGLLVPAVLIGVSVVQKHKEKMLISGLTLASVLLLNAGATVDFFIHAGWLGFASLGAAAILIASLLERFGAMISVRARRWFVAT